MTEGTLLDALRALTHRLVDELDADAAIISRVLGDALVIVTETTQDDRLLSLGQGFLVSDYPRTQEVLESGEPVVLTLDDPDVDAAEAGVLRELGFATLLMMPFELRGAPWGLVEVYRTEVRPFDAADVERARAIAQI